MDSDKAPAAGSELEPMQGEPMSPHFHELDSRFSVATGDLRRLHSWWRAANYLSVGQIYLLDNPLLTAPLAPEHIKPRLLGHWGTTPGINFIYAHLNRIINARDLDILPIIGPGHGGPALVANTWLEGSYSERYPDVPLDGEGMRKLFRQFSFPGGIPSHCAPDVPGSIHEGGELGYSLAHAFGAAFDNPQLVVACIVGDGEAETGPLATAWHSNKFLNPCTDGTVLPILHLNGYKIANPTVLARIPRQELEYLLLGYGWQPYFVSGEEPWSMHGRMAQTLDRVFDQIAAIREHARAAVSRPRWPMIVLETPKGWTGPKFVDGVQIEGTWRAHQVPLAEVRTNPQHLRQLEEWMRSYAPTELFAANGAPTAYVRELAPVGERRMGSNPHANGGLRLAPLKIPPIAALAVDVPQPGRTTSEATRVLGGWLREVFRANDQARNFRLFSPDEATSNRLDAVFEQTHRTWMGELRSGDNHLRSDGRVMEVLSEHQCQGWLEGYLLTGRHGLFSCYEAFIHIVDSMFNQHAKWLEAAHHVAWRQPIASLNILLTSHVWRQDHNGFSHQDPGFIDVVLNKKPEVVRAYFPPDSNSLLCVAEHCLRSYSRVNVIVAGKNAELQWLTMEQATRHCDAGIGLFEFASNDADGTPDVVMACAGDVPTLEVLAAVDLLHRYVPDLKIRVINVVDLMTLQPREEHPHGLTDAEFDALFTTDRPTVFAYHGYPWLIHRLTYRRHNHDNLHVRGYKEEGSTTTPFDMVVRNDLDRFHLVMDVIDRVPDLGYRAAHVRQFLRDKLAEHNEYIREHGEDLPEIVNWTWPSRRAGRAD
jgi:xylulose-5-phosphate/fructose-6-phosphate phosphoketolase